MTKEVVRMVMKECTGEVLCEVISHVNRNINAFQACEVPVNSFAKGEVFNVHMPCPQGGFLSVSHGGTAIVVFIEDCGGLLRYMETPKDAAGKKDHLAGIICCHKFGFCCGPGNCRLKFAFIGDGATSKANASATKGMPCLYISGPVRISIGVRDGGIEFRMIFEDEVLSIAVDSG
jgi:hypothetical protein